MRTKIPPLNRQLIVAAILLGLGQAGFFDGIVFHQLLQWHHMFTNIESTDTVSGLELNTLGDGLFHLVDWLLTLAGLVLLWLTVSRDEVELSTSVFIGAFCMGAGMFNVVEGILSHHVLQIHHVKPGTHQLAYDLGFIGAGILSIAIGWFVLDSNRSIDTAND
ncbi:DUF2243 domain-containing protein [Pleurocapsa sp. CCALA 161]|uniref:DUF2243 domain-containing protein n=1 Tax=Pleurocapsa sp. CCALA 161 TaxID=2107688 RepID=UPI000D0694CF|nr:DUF2243 domain-containing protein [Pleurocapsa sp. CCALA 161]PSB08218.1 DUF2243 domain-containing protein [Pleurocapsa sp. CCALA 161]